MIVLKWESGFEKDREHISEKLRVLMRREREADGGGGFLSVQGVLCEAESADSH